jgi:DNA-binding CsgD family transcriptional regulator
MSTQLAPQATDPLPIVQRRLSQREIQVLELADSGHSNKVIACSLGISTSAVSTFLGRARRKARDTCASQRGVATGGIALSSTIPRAAHGKPFPARVPKGPVLTPAERAVIDLALAGLSNSAIASERRCSAHTVGHQLASAYKKLGIASRRELRANLVGSIRGPGRGRDCV